MLKRTYKKGHPCLVPDLSGKALSFSPLTMMLPVGFFIDILSHIEEIPPSLPSLLSFYHES